MFKRSYFYPIISAANGLIFNPCPEKEDEAEEDHLIMMKYNKI